jgi:hypothetical protein
MYFAMFSTGDQFLEEPQAIITGLLTHRPRLIKFCCVVTRYLLWSVHCSLPSDVMVPDTPSKNFELFESFIDILFNYAYQDRRVFNVK